MKKLLVASVIFLLSMISYAEEQEKVDPLENKMVRVELKDVVCGPIKQINDKLKELAMAPIFMAISEVNNYQTMVWIDSQKNVIFVRYADDTSACIMGMGALIILAAPDKKIDV